MANYPGTNNDDLTNGTNNADTIFGLDGNDSLNGLGGRDIIDGGAGNDTINGGSGDDVITGGTGNDTIIGGAAIDTAVWATAIAASSTGGPAAATWVGATLRVTTMVEGTDNVTQTEFLQFNGRTFAVDLIGANVVAQLGADTATGAEDTAGVTGNVLANDYDVDSVLVVSGLTGGAVGAPLAGLYGSLTLNANGTYSYVPNANASGVDSFTYSVNDGGATLTQTLTITITAVNDAPTTTGGAGSTNEDVALTGTLTGSDLEGNALTFSGTGATTYGNVVVNANGTFTYTPNADFNGTDSFTYGVSDGLGGTTTGIYTVSIAPANDAPTANVETGSGDEDDTITGQIVASDIDNDPLSYALDGDASHGQVTVDSDGLWSYQPDDDFNGSDSFTYTVSDGQGGTTTGTVSITVNPVNDDPIGSNDSANTDEDTPVSGTVTVTDADAGDTFDFDIWEQPENGTASIDSNGTWTYTPDANFNGYDSFIYEIVDGNGGYTTATIDIFVAAENDAPVSNDFSVTTGEDTATGGTLTSTDVDDGDTATYSLFQGAANGTAAVNADGTWTYTPFADYNGPDSFQYQVEDSDNGFTWATVTVNVTASNDAPRTVDSSIHTNEDTPISGTVTATDAEGDTLAFTVLSDPSSGALVMDADGNWTYTPDANVNGSVEFTYQVDDGNGGVTTGTVEIDIDAVNDLPVTPGATATTNEDMPTGGTLTATDVEGEEVRFFPRDNPANGSVEIDTDGTWTYTPNPNFNGTDSFTYEATDDSGGATIGTVSITINPLNDAPVGDTNSPTVFEDSINNLGSVAATDAEGDALTYALDSDVSNGVLGFDTDGSYSYTPNANFFGTDSFTYLVDDGIAPPTLATFTFNVTGVDDAPVAIDASASTNEDVALGGTVGAVNVDQDELVYAGSGDTAHGSVIVDAGGSYIYTPDAEYSGSDSFDFTVTDPDGNVDTGTVTVTVNAVDDSPVANAGSGTVAEDPPAPLIDTVSGSDVDSATVQYFVVDFPQHGTLTYLDMDTGEFEYIPDPEYSGSDSFTFVANDGNSDSAVQTYSITVSPESDDPIADPNTVSTLEDVPYEGVAVGSDNDGDTLTYSLETQASNGTVVVAADGAYIYTPDLNFNGTDSFQFTVDDGTGGSSTATITINVGPVNDSPSAPDTTASTTEDTALIGSVAATDVDGDSLTFSGSGATLHGNVVVNADGSYTYTPNADYNGTDSFEFSASDGVLSDTGVVTVTIGAVNDNPTSAPVLATTDEDMATGGTLTATDIDLDSLTFALASNAANGVAVVNADRTWTYTPDANFYGTDSFDYLVEDGQGASTTQSVTITVNSVNDAPTAVDIFTGATEDTTLILDGFVLNTFNTDPEGDSLTFSGPTRSAHGDVTLSSDGSLVYTPDANFSGTDSFDYTSDDGEGGTNTGTWTFNVAGVNDAPTTPGATVTIDEDGTTGGILAAADAEGDPLTFNYVSGPTNGGATFGSNGQWTYAPTANFNGVDYINYTVTDGHGGSTAGVITINVTAVNDAPTGIAAGPYTVSEDATASGTVSATDPDSGSLTYALVAPVAGLTFNPDGTWTFDPTAQAIYQALGDNQTANASFSFTAYDGSVNSAPVTVSITVTGQNEVVTGTVNDDSLIGGGYADTITALAGDDVIGGGGGDDIVFGLGGDDTISGGAGNDTLWGGDNNDVVNGGAGGDIIYGEAGVDELSGSTGDDFIYGGDGQDRLDGGSGSDLLHGDAGNDTIYGGDNGDTIDGGAGVDTIYGEAGNDYITGGTGADKMRGGDGADTFIVTQASVIYSSDPTHGVLETDIIYDFSFAEGDRVDLSAIDAIFGTGANDAFNFVTAFTRTAGEATLTYQASSNRTLLRLDVDGDGEIDYQIRFDGNIGAGVVLTGGEPAGTGGWIL